MNFLSIASVLIILPVCRGQTSAVEAEEVGDNNQTKRSIAQAFADNPTFYRMFLKDDSESEEKPTVFLSENPQKSQIDHRSIYLRLPTVTINADISTSDESDERQETEVNEKPDLNDIVTYIKQSNTVSSQEPPKVMHKETNTVGSTFSQNVGNTFLVPSETATIQLDDSAKEKVYMIMNKRLLNILQPNEKYSPLQTIQTETNEIKQDSSYLTNESHGSEDVSPLGNIFGRLLMQAMNANNKHNPTSEEIVPTHRDLEIRTQGNGENKWTLNSIPDLGAKQTMRMFRSNVNDEESEQVASQLLGLRLQKLLNERIERKLQEESH